MSKLIFIKRIFTTPNKKYVLFAVSIQVYKIRMYQSNILSVKIAVLLNVMHVLEINFYI